MGLPGVGLRLQVRVLDDSGEERLVPMAFDVACTVLDALRKLARVSPVSAHLGLYLLRGGENEYIRMQDSAMLRDYNLHDGVREH